MKQSYKLLLSLLIGIVALLFSSCGDLPLVQPPPASEVTLLTGECLTSTELTYNTSMSAINRSVKDLYIILDDYPYPDKYVIDLYFNPSFDRKPERSNIRNSTYRYDPTDEVFIQFGKDALRVQREYLKAYSQIIHITPGFYQNTTVFYNKEDVILTANKEFAGYAPGDNLIGLCLIPHSRHDIQLRITGIEEEVNNCFPFGRLRTCKQNS